MIKFPSCAYWNRVLGGILLMCTVGTANAVIFSGNGHQYQVVILPATSWNEANANLKANLGSDWYLATVTSQNEQTFLANLIANSGGDEYWLGGFQNPLTEPVANAGWTWVTGEPWAYTAWGGSEPNDGYGLASEQYLGISTGSLAWNDEGNLVYINGYVAESAVPEPSGFVLLLAGVALLGWTVRRRKPA